VGKGGSYNGRRGCHPEARREPSCKQLLKRQREKRLIVPKRGKDDQIIRAGGKKKGKEGPLWRSEVKNLKKRGKREKGDGRWPKGAWTYTTFWFLEGKKGTSMLVGGGEGG